MIDIQGYVSKPSCQLKLIFQCIFFMAFNAYYSRICTIGVMQDFYEQHRFHQQTVEISLVGTIAHLCINLLGPLAQALLAVTNTRISLCIGTLLCTIGLVLAGSSQEVYITNEFDFA